MASVPTYLARVTLNDDVASLADLAGFRGDGVRGTGVGAGEVIVVQLFLGGHGVLKAIQIQHPLPMCVDVGVWHLSEQARAMTANRVGRVEDKFEVVPTERMVHHVRCQVDIHHTGISTKTTS